VKKKSKIAVVTGGAGFIGSHMVDLLIKKNFIVNVIDNFSGGHKKNLVHMIKNPNLKLINQDICNIKKNNKYFKNAKYVFHFAGIGDIVPSIQKPLDYMNTNIQGTARVLEAARYYKVKKFVYAASSSCYGITKSITSENHRIDPLYPYAFSKYLGEQTVLHWNKVYGLQCNIIRIFNAYGTRVRTTGAYGAVFGVFFKQKLKGKPLTIVGNGKQKRDFIYVTDVAEAFLAAAETKKNNEIFNLGAGKPQTIKYLVSLLSNKTIKIPDRPGEPKVTWANTKKIKKFLKWQPKVSFNDGVKMMLKDINNWKDAPLWTPKKIKEATKLWFKFMNHK